MPYGFMRVDKIATGEIPIEKIDELDEDELSELEEDDLPDPESEAETFIVGDGVATMAEMLQVEVAVDADGTPKGEETKEDEFHRTMREAIAAGDFPNLHGVAKQMLDEHVPGHIGMTPDEFEGAFRQAFGEGDRVWEEFSRCVNVLLASKGFYAGVPIPIEGRRLTLHEGHPFRLLNGSMYKQSMMSFSPAKETEEDIGFTNKWYDETKQRWVFVVDDKETGRRRHCFIWRNRNGMKRLGLAMDSLQAVRNWSLEAEEKAEQKLRYLISEIQFKNYKMAGMFSEHSSRSNVLYLLRRMRPTIAISSSGILLSVLCFHPIGFYDQTWAGVLPPTDDVVAHLLMIRADERKFWAMSNHHEPRDDEAGL